MAMSFFENKSEIPRALAVVIFQTLISLSADAKSSLVNLKWTYDNITGPIEVYTVKPNKSKSISETAAVDSVEQTPALKLISGPIKVEITNSQSVVLTLKNNSDRDIYFFAVPHEVNPHNASAGHYFECLCIGRLYKVPPQKTWYRIVRINLNKYFESIKEFTISHKIVGVTASEANSKYKDMLYND
jgi:hypothetical protein